MRFAPLPSTGQELLPRKRSYFSLDSAGFCPENRCWRSRRIGELAVFAPFGVVSASGAEKGAAFRAPGGPSGEGERGRGGGGSSRALEEDGDAGSWLGLRKSPPLWF